MKKTVTVYGAGLAGCEAAWQAVRAGARVRLYEMKPEKYTPAHHSQGFAELVCSNSLRSDSVSNAVGLLKEELRRMGSLIMEAADATRVPAGSALAVDREKFSAYITEKIKNCPDIEIISKEADRVVDGEVTVIATGPLTSEKMADYISKDLGCGSLHFFDAAAPIVDAETINMDVAFFASRYDKGDADYINCPMNEEQYNAFWQELVSAEEAPLKDFDREEQKKLKVFEGCMPVEVLAKRHMDALRFGPLKPVGLTDPHTGKRPYAVVQLRKETNNNDLYNLVGFQTNLTYPEQKRIFSLIPALKNAEFYRFGTMHKNSFVNAPKLLRNYRLINYPNIYIAGQLSGVEGYIESIASGLNVALNVYQNINGKDDVVFEPITMIGALNNYLNTASAEHFQPMSSNMGLINSDQIKMKDKKQKNKLLSDRALESIKKSILDNNLEK